MQLLSSLAAIRRNEKTKFSRNAFSRKIKKITYSDSRLLEEEKLSRLKLNFKGKTVQPIGLKFSVFITKGKPMAVLEKERAINYLP